MANNSYRTEILRHINPKNLTFSVFTNEEIKAISVVEIVTPLVFDSLGNPVPGGLYDKRLGPIADNDKNDVCGSCHKNSFHCPGHFGHISLPLPLVNPIFHGFIGRIIKLACLHCYKMQIPVHIKKSIMIKMKLLDCGLVTEAQEVENTIMELIAQYDSFDNIPEECMTSIMKYETLADETLDKARSKIFLNKNVESLRNEFINNMLSEVKMKKICSYCQKPIVSTKVIKNKIILNVPKVHTSDNKDELNTSMLGKVKAKEEKYMTPEDSLITMRKIWDEEKEFVGHLVSVLRQVKSKHPTDIFYFKVIPVPPTNVRPVNVVNGRMMENAQTQSYKQILFNIITLKTIIAHIQKKTNNLSDQAKELYRSCKGSNAVEKLNNCWEDLQNDVNGLIDKDSIHAREGQGLKQLIEKKSGIIRMHMMGKRVNYAARSVITPDPNLNIDEIGVPEEFAKHLTYPVPVTTWNVEHMRQLILNGPNVHPGANMVEFENGRIIRLNSNTPVQQESILKRLLTTDDDTFKGVKIVHRHLQNGDVLLLNRQPTLHKPSIMAHKARILRGEKTLRLHYANCKAYNADFDGDEMNAHFPQNELARSEAYNLANVSNQYLVPKDGTPLSGLIQDHMIAGVKLSLRGRFFNRNDYQQLVYQALSYKTGEIILLPPAIIKPVTLWSGKQIFSTVLINIIPKGTEPINLTATAKIPSKAWKSLPQRKWKAGGREFKNPDTMSEAEVIIRNGELLVGVLDKTHYGATPYGLIHCVYELYGGTYAIRLLSSFAKLFTRFLQQEGFTLGVRDILTIPKADAKRTEIIKKSRQIGKQVIANALDLPEDMSLDEMVASIEKASVGNPKLRANIDREYKSSLDSYNNDINKVCLPAGLICKFPQNNLQLMVQSGAKGSTVNTMQISCLLGQIELEGKRPPLMISGRSLPSFPPFEFAPRAGGFIDGRFMTGIQPQEFFFHCMAGREGLIDTAVKTSRSGYLQRCLIKHLEGLHVGYDMTVRDSDRSVIQFAYGEDGLDTTKSQFLNSKQLPFLAQNVGTLMKKDVMHELKKDGHLEQMDEHRQKLEEWSEKGGKPKVPERTSPFLLFTKLVKSKLTDTKLSREQMLDLWNKADDELKSNFREQCIPYPDPVTSLYQPDCYFGSLNERIEELMTKYSETIEKKKHKKKFENVLKLKVMESYCSPGEPVGLLAAQSVGEPSTQMTLNTFHFAGRGDMNVTLGIPRLREILMMASKKIKTPAMEVPFLPVRNLEHRANDLRLRLTRVVVADVLKNVNVKAQLTLQPVRQHTYKLRFNFLPHESYKSEYCVTPKKILRHIRKRFLADMFDAIKKVSKVKSNLVLMEDEKKKTPGRKEGEDSDDEEDDKKKSEGRKEDESSDEEVEDEEDAKMTTKIKLTKDFQEPDLDEREESDEEYDEEVKAENNVEEEDDDDNSVVQALRWAQNYIEDKKKHLWCEITFALSLNFKKLDMTGILRDVASKSIIWETQKIKRAITYMKDDVLTLRTDGINILELFKHKTLLDLNKLYCNDIHKMAETYGVEAAAKIIVKEVKDVFNVYGIKVDPRHLSLIADYMTFNGTFEPLSRKGMDNSTSPLQQMSFESSLTFLKAACAKGKQDTLRTPSSCLMVGKPCITGTGSFSLLQNFK